MNAHSLLGPQSLQDSHYRQMVDAVKDYAIAFLDVNGLVVSWNAGAPNEALASETVLVVDDNRDSANSLALVLGTLGYQTRVAYSGTEAIDALKAQPFAAVLLDLGLPDVGGVQVAEEIRKAVNHPPTLTAVTGYGQENDRAATRAAGFTEHFTKPVDVEALNTLWQQLLEGRKAPSASTQSAPQ